MSYFKLDKTARLAVAAALASILGFVLLFSHSYMPSLMPEQVLWAATLLSLVAGPSFFLACVIVTVANDIYKAFTDELEPQSKARLDRFLGALIGRDFHQLAVTSTSSFRIYNAVHGDTASEPEEPDIGDRFGFSPEDLSKRLKTGYCGHENLSDELKAAVLEAMMEEYQENNPA